ncbi:MAG: C69 family dipeptidase, partial [Bacteroidales bacterium]|nr:C69 family dipeptidase [Bacteroidales bacterium]
INMLKLNNFYFKQAGYLLVFLLILNLVPFSARAQDLPDWEGGYPDGCTTITVGKMASDDGSVFTSHTDDSHRTRSWMNIIPAKNHKEGSVVPMYKRMIDTSRAMPAYKHVEIGEIPQVPHTYAFLNTAYPSLNEHQLGIGESTFGGRSELKSEKGLIDCQRLCQLMLERCTTARDAIRLAGDLTKKYGWNDSGEALTIADKNEVWHLEIMGAGKGKVGSVWVAQRVPDHHVSINANASTIKEIDLGNPDYFMASENIFQLAKENGWWNEKEGPFQFCYAYAPRSRESLASRRREWRVFDLLAPSLKLNPWSENFPFSVKPDELVTKEKLVSVFKDYYEGTEFNVVKDLTVSDENGKTVISPLANPHMPYDENKLFRINGGWGWRGERTIARWYTMYATIIQSRDWLPDQIGGVAWLAMDNVATSIYIPVYCGVTDLPESYKTPGRDGFTMNSAWWAFNRLGTLTAQRWGDMRHDVDKVWNVWQLDLFEEQAIIEKRAFDAYNPDKPKESIKLLTNYTMDWGNKVVNKAWKLGDFLWTKYDEKF